MQIDDDPTEGDETRALMDEVVRLREAVTAVAGPLAERLHAEARGGDGALDNLADYLALRHHDLRPLQHQLMWRGLSSLGRLESRVLPTLDAVIGALAKFTDQPSPVCVPDEGTYFAGERRLIAATDALFGPPAVHRRSRVMVTLPSEAASEPGLVMELARQGMDVARINCAHDYNEAWRAMRDNVHAAGDRVGRRLRIYMDIAGPKIRIETVAVPRDGRKLMPGDRIRLVAGGEPRPSPDVPFAATVSLPQMVTRLAPGDRVRYNDGKLEAVVETVAADEAVIRVSRTKSSGIRLKPEKGINLPDTALGLSPLTAKDEADLATIIECADIIGYSFVSRPGDIDILEEALARFGAPDDPLGLVAKIERPEAVKNLPDLIARAGGRRPFGVMIARGDLAAEIGFERLAEMQEEILWICEAGAVPVVWATQVLEELVKYGQPSRGEMTDAAMAARAECVMLNKGPGVTAAIGVLDTVLTRMDEHIFKKTPTLRALKSW